MNNPTHTVAPKTITIEWDEERFGDWDKYQANRAMLFDLWRASDRSRAHPTSRDGLTSYKFRADCPLDVARWYKWANANIRNRIVEHAFRWCNDDQKWEALPGDCDAQFDSSCSLDELRESMRFVDEDFHIMYQSLNVASEYTGERNLDL